MCLWDGVGGRRGLGHLGRASPVSSCVWVGGSRLAEQWGMFPAGLRFDSFPRSPLAQWQPERTSSSSGGKVDQTPVGAGIPPGRGRQAFVCF